ncbi:MAG TPA: hypothetical protein VIC33_05625 [Vicinamibacterales bacterium]|jgi:hypothetical protein
MAHWPSLGRWGRLVALCALAALAGPLASTTSARAQSAGPQAYTSTLSHARVSLAAGNHVVITMQATGDLPGLLTLTLDEDPATGSFTKGSWALAVSYAEYLPITGTAPSDDPDAQPLEYVNKGTLGGTLTGVTLQIDSNGQLVGLSGVQLSIVSGSLQFDGATGTGATQATGLADFDHTSGSLSLTF